MLEQFEKQIISKIDLKEWQTADNTQKIAILTELFNFAKHYFSLPIDLYFTMPEGFELAFGLSNPATGDIHLNESLWEQRDSIDPLFDLLHEVRHSIQSSHTELFTLEIELNTRYVLQFDGTGYKVDGKNITAVNLLDIHEEYTQPYFTELYLASPCELDANAFAYRCLNAVGASGIEDRYNMWSPEYTFFGEKQAADEFGRAASEIERLLNA